MCSTGAPEMYTPNSPPRVLEDYPVSYLQPAHSHSLTQYMALGMRMMPSMEYSVSIHVLTK